MQCMFPSMGYQFQLKGCWLSVDLCVAPEIISRSDQQVGASDWPQWIFSAKISNSEGRKYFTLANLTNRSHWVSLRSLLGPCFAVVVHNETWWPMLNVHLSYKPLSSWRMLFWSGGYLSQFSLLKKIRALVVPGGGCCKRIIIQGVMTPTGVLPNGQSWLRRKGGVTGASVHALR